MAKRTSEIFNFFVSCLISIWGILTFVYIGFVLVDHSYWFNYTKIESSKPIYTLWEDIYFQSFNIRPLESSMERNDVLYCDFGYWSRRYSEYNSSNKFAQPVDFSSGSKFRRYDAGIPMVKSECYLEANVTADLWRGIKKKQKVLSNTFKIE